MIGVPVAPRRVFGVTLAHGPQAGNRTWVCRAHPGAEGIRVESVETLARLPGGAIDDAGSCRSLVSKIQEAPRSAWGFDFAFGLPADGAPAGGDPAAGRELWATRLRRTVEAEAPDDLPSSGDNPMRRTDRERGLPGPLGPSRRKTTWLAARGILHPLQADSRVVLLPIDTAPRPAEGMPPAMQARVGNIYLLEVAPEALLQAAGVEAEPEGVDARMAALRTLVAAGWVRPLARALRQQIAAEPGGLVAVACAVAAWRGYREYDHARLARDPAYGVEGHAYA